MKSDYSLSINLKSIPFEKYSDKFTFIVNDKPYEVSRITADLLSPIICKYHILDPTISEFEIKQEQNDQTDYFNDFLNLMNFEKIELDEKHKEHYLEYFWQLGNVEEYLKLQTNNFEELTPENIIDHLQLFADNIIRINKIGNKDNNEDETLNIFPINDKIDDMLNYAAKNFYLLDFEKVKKLNIFLIEEIVKRDTLQINDEDSLLNLFIDLYEDDHKYYVLFEYIYFQNVDKDETLERFINAFDIQYINTKLWNSICQKLLKSCKSIISSERYSGIKNIDFKNEEFQGIMYYLNKKTGGNIHDNGTIEITSNSFQNGHEPKNLIDYQNSNYYCSTNVKDVKICFDFKDKSIQLNNYSIKSYPMNENSAHFKNWVIEASNDKSHWYEIDKHNNDSSLRGSSIVSTFNVNKCDKFYRFIQLRQTGENWQGDNYVHFSKIEFYGKLKE